MEIKLQHFETFIHIVSKWDQMLNQYTSGDDVTPSVTEPPKKENPVSPYKDWPGDSYDHDARLESILMDLY